MNHSSAKTDILIKCLYCKEDNPLSAQYCHMCGHIIDLSAYEGAILSKNKIPHKIRIRVAKETCKEAVMLRCVRDPAMSVFNALKQNPNLTYKVRDAIQKKEYHPPIPTTTSTPSEPESGGSGCLWFIIVLCVVGFLITIISNG